MTNNPLVKRWSHTVTLLSGISILVIGCDTPKLKVTTDPVNSWVVIKDPKGGVIKASQAPVVAPLSFSKGNEIYVVEAQPPATSADRYSSNSTQVSSATYEKLPLENDPKIRRLDVKLEEKEYVMVPFVEVVLDAQHSWRGAVTRSRAYKDVSEINGKVPTRILDLGDNLGIQSLALSPDGNRIVYSVATYRLAPNDLQKVFSAAEPRTIDILGANLHEVKIDGGGIEHITSENFRDMFPSFTADGKYILFTSNRRRANSEDVLRLDAEKRGPLADIYTQNNTRSLRPTESEDGTIAFSAEEPNPVDASQRFTIWTLGGPNRFPTQIQIGSQPAISPDGKRIVYIGKDGNVWVVNSDGSLPTQLTFGAEKIIERYKQSLSPDEGARYDWFVRDFGLPSKIPFSYPSWSRDGKLILYTGMEGSDPTGRPNEDIWVMRADGSEKRQLTTNGSIDRYPLVSPDGKWVYFMSNRGGRWAIWRIQGPDASGASTVGSPTK